MTKPQQFWKPKVVVQNQSDQKEKHFYRRGILKGQTWSVKKQVELVKDEKGEVKIEKVFVKNDKEFPALTAYCVEMPKVQQTWAKLFK